MCWALLHICQSWSKPHLLLTTTYQRGRGREAGECSVFRAVQSQAEQSLKRTVAVSLLPFWFFSLHLSVSALFSAFLDGARSFLLSSWSHGVINCSADYRNLLPITDSSSVLEINGREQFALPPSNWGFLLVWSGVFDFLSWTLQSGFFSFLSGHIFFLTEHC